MGQNASKFQTLVATVFLITSSILASTPKTNAPITGAVVRGTLVEQKTLKPMAGRQILLCRVAYENNGKDRTMTMSADYKCDTDPKGHFSISGVPPGTYGLISFHMMEQSELWTSDGARPIDVKVKSRDQTIELGNLPFKTK